LLLKSEDKVFEASNEQVKELALLK